MSEETVQVIINDIEREQEEAKKATQDKEANSTTA